MGMLISNEPDFMIHGVLKYQLFGQDFWITTTTIGMWIITALILILAVLANRTLKKATDQPGTFQNVLEMAYEALQGMTAGILGGNARRFINYIGTIFVFILFCNLSGLLGLRAPTADYGVTFLLGMFTFFIVNYQGIKNRGVRHFTSLFEPTPILFPINLIGEIANPISISLRLFANLLSGVIIMGLWYGMMPIFTNIGIPAALHVYCDVFSGAIQTFGTGEVVGTTTYGKGVVQQIFDLEDGTSVKLTIAEYLIAGQFGINGKGVTPDVEVQYEKDAQNPDRDNQLEKALEEVKNKL